MRNDLRKTKSEKPTGGNITIDYANITRKQTTKSYYSIEDPHDVAAIKRKPLNFTVEVIKSKSKYEGTRN